MQPSECSELRDPTERFVAELTDISASLNSDHEYMAEKGEQQKTLEQGRKVGRNHCLDSAKGIGSAEQRFSPTERRCSAYRSQIPSIRGRLR